MLIMTRNLYQTACRRASPKNATRFARGGKEPARPYRWARGIGQILGVEGTVGRHAACPGTLMPAQPGTLVVSARHRPANGLTARRDGAGEYSLRQFPGPGMVRPSAHPVLSAPRPEKAARGRYDSCWRDGRVPVGWPEVARESRQGHLQ